MVQTDIMSAIRQIAAQRKIEVDEILDAIKSSIKAIFTDKYEPEAITVEMDPEKGFIAVSVLKEVVETVDDLDNEINLADAKKIKKSAKIGDKVNVDVTPEGDFGRIAAQTARQVILQKLTGAEKEAIIRQFTDKVGKIISVNVQKVNQDGDVYCEVSKARALMPKADRVPTEFYRLGSQIKVLLKEIQEDDKGNKTMIVSRADNNFLKELFALEIPEIESGTVEIMAIAREPGLRSKVAVRSNSDGVDPIGACIGQKGVRINAISNELKSGSFEEKIDIILWDEDNQRFLMNALRPAESLKVEITNKKEKEVVVTVPDSQLSLAIGKDGQNSRLASKLTGWKVDVRSDGKVVEPEAPKASEKEVPAKEDDAEVEETDAETEE